MFAVIFVLQILLIIFDSIMLQKMIFLIILFLLLTTKFPQNGLENPHCKLAEQEGASS